VRNPKRSARRSSASAPRRSDVRRRWREDPSHTPSDVQVLWIGFQSCVHVLVRICCAASVGLVFLLHPPVRRELREIMGMGTGARV